MPVVIGAFVLFLLLGLPLAYAFGLAGLWGIQETGLSLKVVPTRLITTIDSMTLLAAPFYILAGEIMNAAGITDRLVLLSRRIVGGIRGATAYANVLASIFFSGISGSSVADTAALGQIFVHGMAREGYSRAFSSAVTVASAIIGPIIPPSITAVIYSAITGVSVISLFVAGVVPGLLFGLACFAVIFIKGRRGRLPEPTPVPDDGTPFWRLAVDGLAVLSLPVVIVWGTVGGVFTPTEAGGVACLHALLLGVLVFRTINPRNFWSALQNAARSSATVFFLVAMVSLASYVLIIEGIGSITQILQVWFADQPNRFMLGVVGLLLVLGMFLEPTIIIIVFIPLLTPVARSLGIDDVHFAMVAILTLTMGMITPPVGINLFIIMRIAGIGMLPLLRELAGFLAAEFAVILLIILVPALSVWLPNLLT